MSETYYFKSSGPEVAEFIRDLEAREDAYHVAAAAFKAELGGDLVECKSWRRKYLVGVQCEEKPEGAWVKKQGNSYWSPDLRSSRGRQMRDRLRAVEFRHLAPPGMPSDYFSSSAHKIYSPGLTWTAPTLWVAWDVPHELIEQERDFYSTIWERAKASEYHLAVEAAEKQG